MDMRTGAAMVEKLTPVQKLMQYMDACARARAEASYTQGYRSLYETRPMNEQPDAARLYQKEQEQWKYCGVVEARFRTGAQRLLHEARKGRTTPNRTLRRRGDGK
jgi:hypothetical protein